MPRRHGAHSHRREILPGDPTDKGWMEPDDRLSAAGLAIDLKVPRAT